MRIAISTYSPVLNGIQGFNTGSSRSEIPTLQTASSNVFDAYRAVPSMLAGDKAGNADQPTNVVPTNTLRVQRSSRNVIYQTATALLATDPSQLPQALQKFSLHDKLPDNVKALLLTKDDKGVYTSFNSVIGRANNGLSSYLFLSNGAFCLDTYQGEAHTLGLGATGWTGIGAVVMLAGAGIFTIGNAENHSHKFDGNDQQLLEAMGVKPDVAGELARHAFTFGDHAPTAGSFLTAYFKYSKVSQKDMVGWLNALTPKQADDIASGLKAIDGDWEKKPMGEVAQAFGPCC